MGPDGVEMSQYEYQRMLKVKRNNKRLRELGLMTTTTRAETQRSMRRAARRSPDNTTRASDKCISKPKKRAKIKQESSGPLRRSTRSRRNNTNSNNTLSPSSSDTIAFLQNEANKLENAERNLMIRRSTRHPHAHDDIPRNAVKDNNYSIRRSSANNGSSTVRVLTKEERSTLNTISPEDDWLEDMAYFMRHKLLNSADNIRQTMDKVRRLANGQGVQHRQSRKLGYVFQKGVATNLGDDLQELLFDAKDWVDEHGGDPGRGWLIVHPVKKLWTYQVARFENGGKRFTVTGTASDVDE